MKRMHLILIIALTATLSLLPCSAIADGAPKFIKAGKSYEIMPLNVIIIILEIDPSGWLKVRQKDKNNEVWLNPNQVMTFVEIN